MFNRCIFIAPLLLLSTLQAATQSLAAESSVQQLDRLLPGIIRTHPGQLYDVVGPIAGPGGTQRYHLKWLTPGGRIVWYDVDAHTGFVYGTVSGQ